MADEKPTQPTPAQEWHKPQGDLYRLPGSGNVARLRRPSMLAMAAKAGHIPNPLTDEVRRFLATTQDADKMSEAQQINSYEKNVKAYVQIAALAFVEPKLILDREPNYSAGEIGPGDVPDLDYLWIWGSVVSGGMAEIAPFRIAE